MGQVLVSAADCLPVPASTKIPKLRTNNSFLCGASKQILVHVSHLFRSDDNSGEKQLYTSCLLFTSFSEKHRGPTQAGATNGSSQSLLSGESQANCGTRICLGNPCRFDIWFWNCFCFSNFETKEYGTWGKNDSQIALCAVLGQGSLQTSVPRRCLLWVDNSRDGRKSFSDPCCVTDLGGFWGIHTGPWFLYENKGTELIGKWV